MILAFVFPISILTFPLIANSPHLFNLAIVTYLFVLWPISNLIMPYISFLLNDNCTLLLIPKFWVP